MAGADGGAGMMRRLALTTLLAGLLGAGSAQSQSLELHGYVDLRAASAGDEWSWLDGGLGKARFGRGDTAFSGGAALAASFQPTPALAVFADAQSQPEQRRKFDLLDAYLRYRPVSTTPWRWSAKTGAFFPPISLENDGIGWTTTRTLTPSAINSWVGEELRTVGVEFRLEHRGERGTLGATAAAFVENDPAGELLASRGWALGDLTTGLFSSLREPDVLAPVADAPVPVLYRPFLEIDDRIGWYAGADWETATQGRAALLYYDNRADPERYTWYAGRELFAWHTRFWSLGAQHHIGDLLLMGQVMTGSTAFEPVPGLLLDTRFHAGYLLAGWDSGDWQPALRFDLFGMHQRPETLSAPLDEHGNAVTLALNWRPRERIRVTGELLRIDSSRDQRTLAGHPARQVDTQVQFGLRLFF